MNQEDVEDDQEEQNINHVTLHSDPPSIFVSHPECDENIQQVLPERDVQRLSTEPVQCKARPSSPSFTPGSLY